MRIVEDTPSSLKLRDRTFWITLVCLAAAAALVAYALRDPRQPGNLVVALMFAAFGLVFLRSVEADFDNGRRVCTLSRLDMFRRTRRELPYSTISNVGVDVSMAGKSSQVVTCRLILETSEGPAPLGATFESGFDRYNRMRDRLAAVIFAPASAPPAPDPFESLVRAGRIVDAVGLLRVRDRIGLDEAMRRVEETRGRLAA